MTFDEMKAELKKRGLTAQTQYLAMNETMGLTVIEFWAQSDDAEVAVITVADRFGSRAVICDPSMDTDKVIEALDLELAVGS